MDTLHVCMTMDVERIAKHSPTGGPATWDSADRSARSYCELLADRGFPPTLFVVPDTATEQGELLQDLSDSTGAEMGLHFHPQCWGANYRDPASHEYLGGYTGEEQQRLLSGALDQAAAGLGQQPRAFRGGNFSANDETYEVLVDLGFTHGSVSQPGRAVTRFRAVWTDACPDVHRAHRAFRMSPGDLDFVEVPLTSDRSVTDHWTGVGDVRIESTTPAAVGKAVRNEVGRQVAEGTPLKHVCLFTHNTVNYWSSAVSEKGKQGVLNASLDEICEAADELGLAPIGSTLSDVREAFLRAEDGEGEASRLVT